ncbi:MAG: DNA lyase [Planctomycetes bacterium]|nr:DNA lyase [Planctomycetota bacterium]
MRLWSIHPSYLDSKGLVAGWREALLARAVLRGVTRGYRHHPQLERFRGHKAPLSAINGYLRALHAESMSRGYRFDRSLIGPVRCRDQISVTRGQLDFELTHLRGKLQQRAPTELSRLPIGKEIQTHPLFAVREGPVESWERGVNE